MSQKNRVYDASFEEWYKRQFNKNFDKKTDSLIKTENMTDEDFEVGTNLYNAYLQKNNLLDQYNTANTSLEKEKTQSQQQASIQLDKLKKYIPTQIKAQGLGGLGVSESTLLKANSDYQNRMGQIASDIGARQLDLLQSYNTGVSDIDTKLADANQITLDKYQKIEQEQEEKARQEREQQKALVDNYYRNEMLLNPDYFIEDGSKLTEDGKNKIKEYLDSNKDVLGEELYNTYLIELESRPVYTNKEKAEEEETARVDLENQGKAHSLGGYGNGIAAEEATEANFGNYNDSDKAGSKQSVMVDKIINKAKRGEIADGTYIDFNYGAGWIFNTGSVYVYYGGKFYPTTYSRNDAMKMSKKGTLVLGYDNGNAKYKQP